MLGLRLGLECVEYSRVYVVSRYSWYVPVEDFCRGRRRRDGVLAKEMCCLKSGNRGIRGTCLLAC